MLGAVVPRATATEFRIAADVKFGPRPLATTLGLDHDAWFWTTTLGLDHNVRLS